MTPLISILIFILGAAIGSFISVLIYRLHKKRGGIFFSRSICTSCDKNLKWRHLIPILSWLALKGKCAYCGKKISVHYFLLEIVTGLTFLTIFLNWNFVETIPSIVDPTYLNYSINREIFGKFLFYIIEFTLLIIIFFYDLLYKEIPDKFSLPAIGIAIAGGLVFGTPALLDMAVGGTLLALFFFLQFVISKGKWIGGGDIRLGALMGILLGWEKGLIALMTGYLIGAVIALYLLIHGKVTKKSAIALGPFLIIGTIIAIFFGDQILNWYLNILTF